MKTKLLLTLACLLAANFIFADSSDYDNRVKRALIDQDVKYEIDDDGDFTASAQEYLDTEFDY